MSRVPSTMILAQVHPSRVEIVYAVKSVYGATYGMW